MKRAGFLENVNDCGNRGGDSPRFLPPWLCGAIRTFWHAWFRARSSARRNLVICRDANFTFSVRFMLDRSARVDRNCDTAYIEHSYTEKRVSNQNYILKLRGSKDWGNICVVYQGLSEMFIIVKKYCIKIQRLSNFNQNMILLQQLYQFFRLKMF